MGGLERCIYLANVDRYFHRYYRGLRNKLTYFVEFLTTVDALYFVHKASTNMDIKNIMFLIALKTFNTQPALVIPQWRLYTLLASNIT